MGALVQWWELRLPQTNRDSHDAWVRIERGRIKVVSASKKAEPVWGEAIWALRWASALRVAPSPAYPWKRLRGRAAAGLEALHIEGRAPFAQAVALLPS